MGVDCLCRRLRPVQVFTCRGKGLALNPPRDPRASPQIRRAGQLSRPALRAQVCRLQSRAQFVFGRHGNLPPFATISKLAKPFWRRPLQRTVWSRGAASSVVSLRVGRFSPEKLMVGAWERGRSLYLLNDTFWLHIGRQRRLFELMLPT